MTSRRRGLAWLKQSGALAAEHGRRSAGLSERGTTAGMERLGTLEEACKRIEGDVYRLLASMRKELLDSPRSVAEGIELLRRLREAIYEDLNQLQHEYAILSTIRWLFWNSGVPRDVIWYWNPRQMGGADEPDHAASGSERSVYLGGGHDVSGAEGPD